MKNYSRRHETIRQSDIRTSEEKTEKNEKNNAKRSCSLTQLTLIELDLTIWTWCHIKSRLMKGEREQRIAILSHIWTPRWNETTSRQKEKENRSNAVGPLRAILYAFIHINFEWFRWMRPSNSCWFSKWRFSCPYHCYHCRFNDHNTSAIGRTHCERLFNGKIRNGMKSRSECEKWYIFEIAIKTNFGESVFQSTEQWTGNSFNSHSAHIQRYSQTRVMAMEIYFRIIGSLFIVRCWPKVHECRIWSNIFGSGKIGTLDTGGR